jgi:SPP1 family predicted phage head-tail adaptor
MNAGTLNRRVLIEQSRHLRDDIGGIVPAWEHVCTVWANITDLSGHEFIAADARQTELQTKITIRHNPRVKATMRALHDTRIYSIETVLGQNKIEQLLLCKRIA